MKKNSIELTDDFVALNDVNRVEVIDEKGRSYVKYTTGSVKLALQDDGRTLKIFISKNNFTK